MRFRALIASLAILWPAAALAGAPSTEAVVEKIEGTVMVDHTTESGEKQTFALGSTLTVSRGDLLTVYEASWVILKGPKGDLIGFEGPATVAFDELFKGGPDRQIRVLLKKGKCLVKAKNAGSRQSFFEVQAGPLVTVLNGAKVSFDYDPDENRVEIRYFGGKLKTTDADGVRKFYVNSRRIWEKGALTQGDPMPLPEDGTLVFKKFFIGEPRR